MRKHLKRLLALATLSLAGIIVYVASDIYRYAQQDETAPADAAIVLGAAAFGNQPSPVLRERVNHAIALYEQGYVQKIILTGGQGRTGSATEAEVAARYAREQGVPQEAILLESESKNTRENLLFARTLGEQYGLKTFLIVSTPFHMKRAMALAADVGLVARSSPTRTIAWISWYTKSRAFVQEVASYLLYLAKPAQ